MQIEIALWIIGFKLQRSKFTLQFQEFFKDMLEFQTPTE